MSRILVDQVRSNSASGDAITLDGNGKCAINATTINSLTFPTSDGSANQLIKTNGSGTLSFETVSAGITMADSWRITSSFSVGSGSNDITSNWERDDNNFENIGTGLTESRGIFSFPATGKYLLLWNHSIEASCARRYVGILAKLSTDTGSNYTTLSESYDSMHDQSGNTTFGAGGSTIIVDVTNETTFRLKWTTSCSGSASFDGNTNQQRTGFTCLKLGDT